MAYTHHVTVLVPIAIRLLAPNSADRTTVQLRAISGALIGRSLFDISLKQDFGL